MRDDLILPSDLGRWTRGRGPAWSSPRRDAAHFVSGLLFALAWFLCVSVVTGAHICVDTHGKQGHTHKKTESE